MLVPSVSVRVLFLSVRALFLSVRALVNVEVFGGGACRIRIFLREHTIFHLRVEERDLTFEGGCRERQGSQEREGVGRRRDDKWKGSRPGCLPISN